MKAKTEAIEASILTDTYLGVLAFSYARNGSFHNTVNELLRAGIEAQMAKAPPVFVQRYDDLLLAIRTAREKRAT